MPNFNDNPYNIVRLGDLPNDTQILHELGYGKVTVDGNSVWRKPIKYTKSLTIKSPSSQEVKSNDAVRDGAIDFYLERKEGNSWVECLSPEDNDNISNTRIIKFGDTLRYRYVLKNGYTLKGSDASKMYKPQTGTWSKPLSAVTEFKAYNDFYIDLSFKPITYSVTSINKDIGIEDVHPFRTPGAIALLQGVSAGESAYDYNTPLFYGDTLRWVYDVKSGYLFESTSYTNGTPITSNMSLTVTSTVIENKISVITSQYGVESYTVKRIPGEVAIEQGIPAGEAVISNNSTIYYGDTISFTAVAKTGYTVHTPSSFTVNNTDTAMTYTRTITSTVNKYNLTINFTGKVLYENQINVTSVKVTRTVGTVASLNGENDSTNTYSNISSPITFNNFVYGDKVEIEYTVKDPYNTPAKYTINSFENNDMSISCDITVKQFNLSRVYNTGVSSITVTRTDSKYQGASEGTLPDDGMVLYYGDSLSVSAVASVGYTLNTYTNTYTELTGNINLNPTAYATERVVYNSADTTGIVRVTITRIEKGIGPGESSGEEILYDDDAKYGKPNYYAKVYYGDKIRVDYVTQPGYSIVSGSEYTVATSDIELTISATAIAYNFKSLFTGQWELSNNQIVNVSNVKITCTGKTIGYNSVGDVLFNSAVTDPDHPYAEATVYYGDSIKVEYQLTTPYNGFATDNLTISGNASVEKYITPKSYTLSVSTTSITSAIIERTNSPYYPCDVAGGDTPDPDAGKGTMYNYSTGYLDTVIYYGDTLQVNTVPTPSEHYTLDEPWYSMKNPDTGEVTPVNFENIASSFGVEFSAHRTYGYLRKSYNSTRINSLTVKRGNTELSTGAVVYDGETLSVSATANPGFELNSYSSTYVVTLAKDEVIATVSVTAKCIAYTLNLDTSVPGLSTGILPPGYIVSRESSPNQGASTGIIFNGASVYQGDVLKVQTNCKSNYVITDAGYNTSRTRTFTVDANTFSGTDYNISESCTYTETIRIYQRAVSNTTLDEGDKASLRVWYPDGSGTIAYDSSKRVRTDQKARLYSTGITPPSNALTLDHASIGLTDNSYYELTPGTNYYLYFEPRQYTLSLLVECNTINSINPELTKINVSLTNSKYKGNTTFSTDYYVVEKGIQEVSLYYKDTVQVTYYDITGWSYSKTIVNGTSETTNNPVSVTMNASTEVAFYRDISSYVLRFHNGYARYTSIKVDGDEQLSSDWNAPDNSDDTMSYIKQYGVKFSKYALTIDGQGMYTNRITHNNSQDYKLSGDTDVYHTYYLDLLSPSSLTISLSANSSGNYDVNISFSNPNGSRLTADLSIQLNRGWYFDPGQSQDYISIDVTAEGGQTYSHHTSAYPDNTVSNLEVEVEVYFKAKTISGVNRTQSATVSATASTSGGSDESSET